MTDRQRREAAIALCLNNRFGEPCACKIGSRSLVQMRELIGCRQNIKNAETVARILRRHP